MASGWCRWAVRGRLFVEEFPAAAVDLGPGLTAFSLVTGQVVHVVLGSFFVHGTEFFEEGVMCDQCLDDLKVLADIGPGVEFSTGFHDAGDELEEGIGENSSTAMLTFPPGVGEVDMHGTDGVLFKERVEGEPGISSEYPGITECSFFEPPCCSAAFPVIDLDPDIIGVRIGHRRVDQEQTSTTAEIEFEWLVFFFEEAGAIERVAHIGEGEEPRFQVLGWWRPHQVASPAYSSFWSRTIGTPIMVPPKTMRFSTNPWKANSAFRP